MAFNHVAFATRDLAATHAFYTEVMGFRLAKVETGPTEQGTGWARHVFYDTGSGGRGGKGMIAFWDLHDETIGSSFPTDLSTSMGLPVWVNHLAFDAESPEVFEAHKQRWREHGQTVVEVDHGWCRSIYITDPNGIMVEFCLDVRPLGEADAEEAERLLFAAEPPLKEAPPVVVHRPVVPAS